MAKAKGVKIIEDAIEEQIKIVDTYRRQKELAQSELNSIEGIYNDIRDRFSEARRNLEQSCFNISKAVSLLDHLRGILSRLTEPDQNKANLSQDESSGAKSTEDA